MSAKSNFVPIKKTPLRLLALAFIIVYQKTLSPFIGQQCCYRPSCSQYAYEAIARYGLWAGGFLTLFRLMRCHPLACCAYDPVPQNIQTSNFWYRPWKYWQISRSYLNNHPIDSK